MRRDSLKVFGRETGLEQKFFALQQDLYFFECRALGRLRVASEASFDKFEVLQNKISLVVLPGQNRIRIEQFLLADDIYLRLRALICLDELVSLVEARILEVVLAEFDFGNTK